MESLALSRPQFCEADHILRKAQAYSRLLESVPYLYGGRSPETAIKMNRENSKGDTDTLSIGPTSRLVRVKLGFDRLLQPGVILRWPWGCRNQSYSQLSADLWSPRSDQNPGVRPPFRSLTGLDCRFSVELGTDDVRPNEPRRKPSVASSNCSPLCQPPRRGVQPERLGCQRRGCRAVPGRRLQQ